MEKDIRRELVKVQKWIQEGKKVYLVTGSGAKYRYVGRNNLQQMNDKFPKGTFLKIRIACNGLLADEQISRC